MLFNFRGTEVPVNHADEPPTSGCTAGFWIRLWAGGVDLPVVVSGVWAIAHVAGLFGRYVPLEMAILLAWPFYVLITNRLLGSTAGKWLYGLAALKRDGTPVSPARLIVRETVGKLLTAATLVAGFLVCGVTKDKRALHDYVAGTVVLRRTGPIGPWWRLALSGGVLTVFAMALDVPGLASIAGDAMAMRSPAAYVWAFENRDAADLMESASVSETDMDVCAEWIRAYASDPIDYAVAKAQQHQVVVFGEVHDKREALKFLNTLIPEAYRRAQVTSVALEVCLAEDNEKLKQLVTAEKFDRGLALDIARHQPWGIWGYKEYWDVLETVWRLNQTIPSDRDKVRVLGLDSPMDMASVGMLGLEDNPAKHCPVWEKLRAVRLPRILPKVLARDVRMARQVEKEILDTGERAIVWVGGQHAWASPQTVTEGGLRTTRMGAMLRRKHGNKLFFVRLHGFEIPMSWIDSTYRGLEPAIGSTIEAIMARSGLQAAGFDTSVSPLGRFRDNAAFEYHHEPRLGLEDIADGYIYLAPWGRLTPCTWSSGYVTPGMFTANKPFYQAFGRKHGMQLRDAEQVNQFFEKQ